jgi:glyoxylase-like metal-dependent hydrolase (beta-lactamase superfamily II)
MAGYAVHVYVVRGAMIDTGFPGAKRDVAAIAQSMSVRGVLLTHHHEDHAGNIEALAHAGIPIAMDSATESLVRNPGRIGLYRHLTWRSMRALQSPIMPFTDDSLALVPTPGHCSNHQAVWDAGTGTLFSGDLFLGVKVRVAHGHENPRDMVRSLRSMAALTPARVLCAHRGLVAHAASALTAKAEWLEHLVGETDLLIDAGLADSVIATRLVGPRTLTHFFSAGDYSAINVVRSIRNSRASELR